jgi:hypothetical protein
VFIDISPFLNGWQRFLSGYNRHAYLEVEQKTALQSQCTEVIYQKQSMFHCQKHEKYLSFTWWELGADAS